MTRPSAPDVYDPRRPCPKCGGRFIKTRFRDAFGNRYGGGVLWRTCERCSYQWSETPLDAAEAKA